MTVAWLHTEPRRHRSIVCVTNACVCIHWPFRRREHERIFTWAATALVAVRRGAHRSSAPIAAILAGFFLMLLVFAVLLMFLVLLFFFLFLALALAP